MRDKQFTHLGNTPSPPVVMHEIGAAYLRSPVYIENDFYLPLKRVANRRHAISRLSVCFLRPASKDVEKAVVEQRQNYAQIALTHPPISPSG